MRAVTVTGSGRPEDLGWGEVAEPSLGPGEVLIDVSAAGVNRADLLQARGGYDPPAGASTILGLECSGTIAARYDDVPGDASHLQVGAPVCALLAGGGYAEQVAVPAAQVLPVPRGVSLVDAAGLPEAVCTVWSNLVLTAGLRSGQALLVHGGSSGIGTMAIQLAAALGARVMATASTGEKLAVCRDLGAAAAIGYTEQDFVSEVMAATDGRGADVILDVVGGKYLQRNISALADGGRLVIIGLLGGAAAELDLAALMGKRAGVIGTQLRTRPVTGRGSKGEVVAAVREHAWPLIEAGRVRPVIGGTVAMDRAGEAHRALLDGDVIGKVVLERPARDDPEGPDNQEGQTE